MRTTLQFWPLCRAAQPQLTIFELCTVRQSRGYSPKIRMVPFGLEGPRLARGAVAREHVDRGAAVEPDAVEVVERRSRRPGTRIGCAGSVHCSLDLTRQAPICQRGRRSWWPRPGSVRQRPDAGLTSSPSVPCAQSLAGAAGRSSTSSSDLARVTAGPAEVQAAAMDAEGAVGGDGPALRGARHAVRDLDLGAVRGLAARVEQALAAEREVDLPGRAAVRRRPHDQLERHRGGGAGGCRCR